MPRLYRPHIPLSVRCAVAERQLRLNDQSPINSFGVSALEGFLHDVPARPLRWRLVRLLQRLAERLICDAEELRLDHDPPLGARPRRRSGLGRKTYYTPDANDPDHLFYRPHGPEHAGSHMVKTNVRGDHGQHPDRVLIKKARRQERSRKGETRRKASKFPNRASGVKRNAGFGAGRIANLRKNAKRGTKPKHRWPKRPLGKRREQ